jgi:hypothetical protein
MVRKLTLLYSGVPTLLTNCSHVLLRLPPIPLSLFFSLPEPAALASHVTSTAAPAPLPSSPRAVPAPAPPLPTPRWTSPRSSTSHHHHPSHHASRRLPAGAPAWPCLLLDLEHVLELPTNPLLLLHTCISTTFPFPEHTSPPPSGTPATGTPTPPLGAPPPVSVHRRPAASALLFPSTDHPSDRRELLNLSPHFPLAAGEPPRRN